MSDPQFAFGGTEPISWLFNDGTLQGPSFEG